MGVTTKKRKCKSCGKLFVPVNDTATIKQMVCCHSCCVIYYDRQKPKSKKLARLVASMLGKRSMGEVKFYAENIERLAIKPDYEPDTFQYSVEETRSYTPDFKFTTKTGKVFYIEYKGVLDLETRKKMVRVRDQHPELDVRFVFQVAKNKIRKGSKTTYGMWCDQNGFKWADNTIPEEWLR